MSVIQDIINLPFQIVRMAVWLATLAFVIILGAALCGCVWWMILKVAI